MNEILNGKNYTLQETADILKVTKKTIENYIKAGKLKATQTGTHRRLITEKALSDYLELMEKEAKEKAGL